MFSDLWLKRYILMAKGYSSWSKDPSTKVGAVIVRPDKSICSLGFNGFPPGDPDLPEDYNNREVKLSKIIHAEENALRFAREKCTGYALFVWPLPCCLKCSKKVVNAGIAYMYFGTDNTREVRSKWINEYERTSKKLLESAGVVCTHVELDEDL